MKLTSGVRLCSAWFEKNVGDSLEFEPGSVIQWRGFSFDDALC